MAELLTYYLPIETLNRELDARLVLAARLASRETRVYVGWHDAIYRLARSGRGGIYFGKNTTDTEPHLPRYAELAARGVRLVHFDDEGGFDRAGEREWRASLDGRLDPRILAPQEWMCTWGRFQRDHYAARRPEGADRVRDTGQPGFDCYGRGLRGFYDPEVRALRERFGTFVLVNTNFAHANNWLGTRDTFSGRLGGPASDPDGRRRLLDRVAFVSRLKWEFVRLIHELAYEGWHVVVRPHPAEDLSFYREATRWLEGVHVVREGPVAPWLLAAEAVIQNGCTTAIETYLAERPVISFLPVADERFDVELPNQFAVRCREIADVIGAVKTGVAGRVRETPEVARQLFSNFGGGATDAILEVLDLARDDALPASLPPDFAVRTREWSDRSRVALRTRTNRRFGRVRRYWASKFYGFRRAGAQDRLRRWAEHLDRSVGSTLLSDDLIRVSGHGPSRS